MQCRVSASALGGEHFGQTGTIDYLYRYNAVGAHRLPFVLNVEIGDGPMRGVGDEARVFR